MPNADVSIAGPPEGGHYARTLAGPPEGGHYVRTPAGPPEGGHYVRTPAGPPEGGHYVRTLAGPPKGGHYVRTLAGPPKGGHYVRAAIVACICAAGASLSATTLVPADFTQMVHESELIVRGTVVSVQAQKAGPRQTIESVITLSVADTMKGTVGAQTVFRVPGGRLGRYRRVMVGAPEFRAGEEVILFLKGRAPAIAMPYGLSQGVYRVARRADGAVVTPAVAAAAGRVVRGDPSRRPLGPEAFARQVQQALTDAPARTPVRRAVPRDR